MADSSVNAEDTGYAYDAAWNTAYRTNNGVWVGFTNNSLNELTSFGSTNCTYDANGNRSTLTSGSAYYLSFGYDDENRLTRIEDVINAMFRTDFVYDGLGRLRQRLEYTNDSGGSMLVETLTATWVLATETRYLYDGNRVIQERDGANTPTVSYTRGTDLSGSLEGAGGIGGLLARSHGYSGGNWSTHNFYHADGNGNVTYLVDSSQGLAASYRYDPFGNLISKSGTLADANVYRFSSKEVHVNSGLYYFLFRFYDPQLQRWLNREPLGEAEDINLYRLAYNEPMGYADRDGYAVLAAPPPTPTTPTRKRPPSIGSPKPGDPTTKPSSPKPKPKTPKPPPYRFLCRLGVFISEMLDPISLNPVDDSELLRQNAKCSFYKAWCDWGNKHGYRPPDDPGKYWTEDAPCDECYKECQITGEWPMETCKMGGPRGPRWDPDHFPPAWPDPD